MVCKTDITAVFIELDIKQEDGCMGSSGMKPGGLPVRSG